MSNQTARSAAGETLNQLTLYGDYIKGKAMVRPLSALLRGVMNPHKQQALQQYPDVRILNILENYRSVFKHLLVRLES